MTPLNYVVVILLTCPDSFAPVASGDDEVASWSVTKWKHMKQNAWLSVHVTVNVAAVASDAVKEHVDAVVGTGEQAWRRVVVATEVTEGCWELNDVISVVRDVFGSSGWESNRLKYLFCVEMPLHNEVVCAMHVYNYSKHPCMLLFTRKSSCRI